MAEIDELLANAEEIDYLADDIQFLIDENLRTVTIPSDGVVLGVEGDKNSNRVNFQMPRYYNGFDMSEFTVRVNYVNANGDPGVYTVKDLEVRDDMILFTWLVDSDACAYVGVVRFLVRMTITNNSELIQAFDTTIAKANVLEGLPITNIVDEEDRYDIVLHLMGEVDEYIEKRVGNIDALEMVGKSTTDVEFANGEVGQNGAEIFNDYEKNVAVGSYSHAEGGETTATSQYAHAEGHQTTAFGVASHAEGEDCYAEGNMSHAEGWGSSTTGAGSHAEGFQSVASGSYSHAEGYEAKAENTASHAEGMSTTASGEYSHAEGNTTVASGENSHAEGYHTKASSYNQHVQGKYNVEDAEEKYAFIIGNGDADDNRSNALAIDWDGKIYVGDATEGVDVSDLGGSGGVGQNTEGITFTIGSSSYNGTKTAEIFNDYTNNKAIGEYSHAEGTNTTAKGKSCHAEGNETTASGPQSHAEGNGTTASGIDSHAEGNGTTASGNYAHAEGGETTASGIQSHAEGYKTTASKSQSHAEGYQTTASGIASHAEGRGTTASGDYSHAEGYAATASGMYSHAEGFRTKASSESQHVQGKYNVEDTDSKYAFIIGNGESDSTRSNALAIDWDGKMYVNNAEDGVDVSKLAGRKVAGTEYTIDDVVKTAEGGAEVFNNYSSNIATGAASHAEGEGTKALSWASHAEGYKTTASGQFSHSEGYKTTASGTYSHAEGGQTTASGDYSHAEGAVTTASGSYAHAEGQGTIAASSYQHVMGKYNIDDASDVYAFIIGNGESGSARSNAFAIRWDGIIRVNNTDINLSKLAGKKVGGRTYTYNDTEYTAGENAEVFNDYTDNKAIGENSHAEGTVTTAIGNGSHAEGNFTRAKGDYSHAEGQDTDAFGFGSHSEGVGTYAKGDYSHAEGRSTIAAGECQHVIGKFNVADEDSKYALIIGNGEITDSVTWERSNAFAIDWDGKIYVNGSDTGVDVSVIPSLIARIEALEAANGS